MVSQACRPEIDAVSDRMLYPGGRLQHTGVVIGLGGAAGHMLRLSAADESDRFGPLELSRSRSDVDFCLKLQDYGYHNLYTLFATLYHHEFAGCDSADDDLAKAAQELANLHSDGLPGIIMIPPTILTLVCMAKTVATVIRHEYDCGL